MATLSLDEAAKRLGITPVKGVRTGLMVAADGDPRLLVQFKRDDDTSTPSYTMTLTTALDLIESLSQKLTVLADPDKFSAFAASRVGNDDHNPPATHP